MNAKNRTIAVLKYINSIESAKSRYINNASENIARAHVLIQQDTKYVLPEKYRKLITLISFYYRPGSFFPLVEMIIERSKNLFGGKL